MSGHPAETPIEGFLRRRRRPVLSGPRRRAAVDEPVPAARVEMMAL